MLTIGTKAPDFSLPDQNGKLHNLQEYAGKKLLIFFYAKDNTSGCSSQAAEYEVLADEFAKKGVIIVGVSKDSVASHKKFEEKLALSYTLLSDTEREMIEAYDVWKEKKLYGKVSMGVLRTTYVIDETGTVAYACDKVKAATDAGKMLALL